jgi:thioredoxin-related protein
MRYLLIVISFVCATDIYSQADTIQPPFKRFPTFPPVTLKLPGNETFTKADLPKKKPVMLMIFSPDCDHCKHETEDLLKNIDLFDKTEIVMATMMPFDSMMKFREKYKLADYKNIIVGQDTHFFLAPFYKISYLPFLAFYDKKGKLISFFQGTMDIGKAARELKKEADEE